VEAYPLPASLFTSAPEPFVKPDPCLVSVAIRTAITIHAPIYLSLAARPITCLRSRVEHGIHFDTHLLVWAEEVVPMVIAMKSLSTSRTMIAATPQPTQEGGGMALEVIGE
jgi:hypothetical protein